MAMIKEVIESILDISPLTVVSHGNVRNKSLRRHLLTSLKSQTGDSDGFLAEPFFEGMFPWTNADRSLQEMVSKGEIGRMAVDAIRSAMPEMERLRKHQAESLKAIRAGKSIVVTTGTGSGKTECFLYPIIDALAKELEGKQDAGLDGVRALFLYPLNALIESQRERFKKLCDPFGGRIRFALYNGNTPDQGRSNDSEMKCRKEIRAAASGATPPNLLITNSTMLELALVRPVDRHIFEKSRGRLQFVVLDEAHTYLGSDAAELAMRLRRTLDAFGVAAENVRFIATSATTGTDTDSLREFLARIAGIPSESVEVIGGARYLPSLPKPSHPPIEPTEALEMLRQAKDGNASFEILVRTPKAIELRSHLLSKKMELGEIASSLGLTKSESLEFIDKASVAAQTERPSSFFLPVKIHLFQRAFHGVWACWNPECTHKQTELGDDWKFGRIHLTGPEPSYKADGSEDPDWDKCSCGSSVFEVVYCGHCGEVHLAAQMKDRGDGDFTLRVPGHLEDVEEASDDLIPDDQEETDETKTVTKNLRPALIPPAGEIANVRWNQNGEVNRPGFGGELLI
jgi:DEAD/DEAH box helicase domain-containing protein